MATDNVDVPPWIEHAGEEKKKKKKDEDLKRKKNSKTAQDENGRDVLINWFKLLDITWRPCV